MALKVFWRKKNWIDAATEFEKALGTRWESKDNLTLTERFFSSKNSPGLTWASFSLIATCLLMVLYHLKSRKFKLSMP